MLDSTLGLYDLRLICDNISSSFHGLVVTDLDDYEGEFWSLTVEASFGEGVSISVFGSPNEYPFSGGTWGISGGPVVGLGASASYAETNYTRKNIR